MKQPTSKLTERNEESPLDPLARPIDRAVVREVIESPEFAQLIAEIVSGQPERPKRVNAKQIAETFGVSPSTISLLKKQGLPYLLVGQEARFDVDEVETWLRERQARRDGAA